MAHLFIFAGLPGTGKTTLSQGLAQRIQSVYLRIDTIEQGLRDLCKLKVEGEGYRLAYRVAADNLKLGRHVIADSCNPWELTRREWERVGLDSGATFTNIEVICSDVREHRLRVEERSAGVPGLKLPTWREVKERDYHNWSKDRVVVDTAGRTVEDSLEALWSSLEWPH